MRDCDEGGALEPRWPACLDSAVDATLRGAERISRSLSRAQQGLSADRAPLAHTLGAELDAALSTAPPVLSIERHILRTGAHAGSLGSAACPLQGAADARSEAAWRKEHALLPGDVGRSEASTPQSSYVNNNGASVIDPLQSAPHCAGGMGGGIAAVTTSKGGIQQCLGKLKFGRGRGSSGASKPAWATSRDRCDSARVPACDAATVDASAPVSTVVCTASNATECSGLRFCPLEAARDILASSSRGTSESTEDSLLRFKPCTPLRAVRAPGSGPFPAVQDSAPRAALTAQQPPDYAALRSGTESEFSRSSSSSGVDCKHSTQRPASVLQSKARRCLSSSCFGERDAALRQAAPHAESNAPAREASELGRAAEHGGAFGACGASSDEDGAEAAWVLHRAQSKRLLQRRLSYPTRYVDV